MGAVAIIGMISAALPLIEKGFALIRGGDAKPSTIQGVLAALGVVGQGAELLMRAAEDGRDVTPAERDATIAESRRLNAELDAELTEAAKKT